MQSTDHFLRLSNPFAFMQVAMTALGFCPGLGQAFVEAGLLVRIPWSFAYVMFSGANMYM